MYIMLHSSHHDPPADSKLLRILLVDLHSHPFSPEAAESRTYIDKTFQLSGPDGGVSSGEDRTCNQRPLREGGKEAWDMLRRLRQKAWTKAGLDPDMLMIEPKTTKRSDPENSTLAVDLSQPETNGFKGHSSLGQSEPSRQAPLQDVHPTVSDATPVPNTVTSSFETNGFNLQTAIDNVETPHDFDWEQWDAVFGQYAPLDEEGLDLDDGSPWYFDQ